jgi:hypothetical protein
VVLNPQKRGDQLTSDATTLLAKLQQEGASTISVDPVDGCTMVFTTQFQPATGNFNWSTFIHSFKLSTCN